MKRLNQIVLIVTFIGFSWLSMQVVHEFGHIVGAKLTGAVITKVVLHPCAFSRTDLGFNPHPLLVVWAGPVIGSFIPLMIFLLAKRCRLQVDYLFRFFAGFCLIANGFYIMMGAFNYLADAGVMLQYGSPRWALVAFGVFTAPLGLLRSKQFMLQNNFALHYNDLKG